MFQNQGKIPLTDRVSELITILGSERLAQNPIENLGRDFVDLGSNIDSARTAAKAADVPLNDLIRGLSGSNVKQTKDVLAQVNKELERMVGLSATEADEGFENRRKSLEAMRGELEKVIEQQKLADELSNSVEFIDAQKVEERAARAKEALDATTEAWKSRLSELSSARQNAATDASNYFTKTEEGATEFDWCTYLTDAEATIAAADEMKQRLVGLPDDIRAEAERIFSSQGAVAANEYTKAYEGASAADKGRFEAAAGASGDAAGRAQAAALKAAFGTPTMDATVKVGVDSSAWDSWTPKSKTGYVNPVTDRTGGSGGRGSYFWQ